MSPLLTSPNLSLMLLHNGHVAYYGSRANAPSFFSSKGYPCPPDYNPADFYIKTLAAQAEHTELNGTVSQDHDILKLTFPGSFLSLCSREIVFKCFNGTTFIFIGII